MFTKKSLLIGAALLLVCAVAAVTVISSVTPSSAQTVSKTYNYTGVAAIPVLKELGGLLDPQDITQYLRTQGIIGGTSASGKGARIQNIRLTNVNDLSKLQHITIPGLSGKQSIYYVLLHGPFTLSPNLSQQALSTLIPSAGNLPLLGNLPIYNMLPGLNGLGLSNPNSNAVNSSSNSDNTNPLNSSSPDTILEHVYEVFNANNGNLLAWG